ncbi:MAG TPA: glycosyltransferase [Blastocatellia bacterium]|nr:glycosyltransferase [Blastocatellia bacterium]
MKVAYLNPTGQLGGAEKALLDLIISVRAVEPQYEPHLIVAADGPFAKEAAALQIPVHIVPLPFALARLGDSAAGGHAGTQTSKIQLLLRLLNASFLLLTYARQLRRMLVNLAPAIIHSNGFKMHALGLLAAPRSTPLVWHIHDYISSRPVMKQLVRWGHKRCAAIIANSHSVAEDIQSVCSNKTPIHPVHNAIDLNYFSPLGNKLELDALAGLPPTTTEIIRVALLGTMARWKGHEVFLRALSLLPATLPVRGYVIGGALYQTDGSQYSIEELRQSAAKLGLQHRVGFTGFISDPAAAMRACDIVVHASTAPEPFGLVIAEAMACARAVIVSQAGGATELVQISETALGHTPGNAQELADRITQLVTNAAQRQQLGAAAHQASRIHFTHHRLANEILPIYKGLLVQQDYRASKAGVPAVANYK